mmetsp:Transcript_40867/g.73827  ORF Transcript_40867/g.73827 Transcript_40867/m.73827 type:complete len:527 (+) Transcript_40867:109-1689(+)
MRVNRLCSGMLSALIVASCLSAAQAADRAHSRQLLRQTVPIEDEVSADVREFTKLDLRSSRHAEGNVGQAVQLALPNEEQVLKQEVHDLKLRIGSLQDDKVELVRTVQQVLRSNQSAALEERLHNLAEAKADEETRWNHEAVAWQAEEATLKQNLSKAQAQYADLQDGSDQLARFTKTVQAKEASLQAEKEELQKKIATLEMEKEQLVSTVHEVMQKPSHDAAAEETKLKESAEKWANTSLDLSSELSRVKANMKLMDDQNHALLAKNQALQKQVSELEARPVQEELPPPSPTNDVVRLKDQQLRSVMEQNLILHSQQDTMDASAKKMEAEEKQLAADKANLMTTVRSLMRDNAQQKSQFQVQTAGLQDRVKELEKRLSAQAAAEKRRQHRGSHPSSSKHLEARKPVSTPAVGARNPGTPTHRASLKVKATPRPAYSLDTGASDDAASDMGDAVAMERYVHEAQMKRLIEEASQEPPESLASSAEVEPHEEDVDITSMPGNEDLSVDVSKLLHSAQGVLRDIRRET